MPEKRILLLEDDDLVSVMLETALSTVGYAVDVAMTAAEGWARLAGQRYALVIADWKLPDGDGSVIADGAAEQGAKAFLMSGYVPDMPAGVRQGHRCMMKPIRIGQLLSHVHDAIGSP